MELYTQWKFPDLASPEMPSPDFLQEKLSVAGFNFIVRAFPFLFKEKNQVLAYVLKRVAVYGAPLVPVFSLGMRRLSTGSRDSDGFKISSNSSPRSPALRGSSPIPSLSESVAPLIPLSVLADIPISPIHSEGEDLDSPQPSAARQIFEQ